MNIRIAFCLCALALAAGAAQAATATKSVQVRNGQLRAAPNFLGKIVASVAYGDVVTVGQQQAEWVHVTAAAGAGWIHQSALSDKKVGLKAGAQNVNAAASGEELALAGKGFNSDVEADFKKRNANVDFTWIDRMEKYKVTPFEITAFLTEGGIKPNG